MVLAVALAVVLAGAGACGADGDGTDDGRGDGRDHAVTIDLTVRSAAGGRYTPRVGDAAVVRLVGDDTDYSERFDPRSGTYTTSEVLPAGTYSFWVEYVATRGSQAVVVDSTSPRDLTLGKASVPVTLALGRGFFVYRWSLYDSSGNLLSRCAEVPGQSGVEILATLASSTAAAEEQYRCDDGISTGAPSDPLPLGRYLISGSILGASGQRIGTSASVNGQLREGNDYENALVSIRLN